MLREANGAIILPLTVDVSAPGAESATAAAAAAFWCRARSPERQERHADRADRLEAEVARLSREEDKDSIDCKLQCNYRVTHLVGGNLQVDLVPTDLAAGGPLL